MTRGLARPASPLFFRWRCLLQLHAPGIPTQEMLDTRVVRDYRMARSQGVPQRVHGPRDMHVAPIFVPSR